MKKYISVLAVIIIIVCVILILRAGKICAVTDKACLASLEILGKAIEEGESLTDASERAYECAFFGEESLVKAGGFYN